MEEAITDLLEGKDTSDKTGENEDKGMESNSDGGDEDTETETSDSEEEEDDGVQVTESMMQSWIETLARITPKR